MGDADAYDEFEPLDAAGEDDDIEPLEIDPYCVPIEAHDPEIGGPSVVRLFFQPGDRGAAPAVDGVRRRCPRPVGWAGCSQHGGRRRAGRYR